MNLTKHESLNRPKITVPKRVLNCMLADFEHLLSDFEAIAEEESTAKAEKRLKDVKEKKVEGLSEKDFAEFLKKEGVNA